MSAQIMVMPKLLKKARAAALLERVDVFNIPEGWWAKAACTGLPIAWFYEGGPNSRGAQVCAGCPVRECCLIETVRVEARLNNLEDVAGHRCLSAEARRDYLARTRTKVA